MWVVQSVVSLCFVTHAAAARPDWDPQYRTSTAGDWNPEFYADYWPGVCATGESQSPLTLPDEQRLLSVPEALLTTWGMPKVQKPIITHTGHAIEVCFMQLGTNVMS